MNMIPRTARQVARDFYFFFSFAGPFVRPVGHPPVRQKPRSTHGIPAGDLPCARSPVPRTASCRSPFRASEGRFHARHPCWDPHVRQKVGFTHGIPAGVPSVRQKVGSTHGIPAGVPSVRQKPGSTHGILPESLPCVRRSVSRTTSRRSPSRAPEAPFHARYPCGVPSVRQKPCFTHGIPVGDPPVRQNPGSTHGGCPRRLTSAGRRVDIQKKFFCFLASAHVSFLYLRLLCILLRL